MLYSLTQQQLAIAVPLRPTPRMKCGRWPARRAFLAQKPDSQEICFVEGNDYVAFIAVCGRAAASR